MDDLISRQAAIDALMAWEEDSVWDEECLKHRGEPFWISPSDVIENLLAAEPEIIRCKDCLKYDAHDHRCKHWNHAVVVRDWCSRAERKTDNE